MSDLLPTAYTPQVGLAKKVIGVYGRPGIGKSSLAAMFQRTIVAQTEAGLEHLDVPRIVINSWAGKLERVSESKVAGGFLDFCREVVVNGDAYDRICIDTFDNLCRICTEHMCEQLNIDDIGDYKKFGAYHLVTGEVHRIIKKLTNDTRFGLTLISHEKEEEVETKTKKYKRKTISVSGKNRGEMLDICHMLLFMSSKMDGDDELGLICTKPSLFHEAKDKDQALPEEILYDISKPKEAYDQIVKGFEAKAAAIKKQQPQQ